MTRPYSDFRTPGQFIEHLLQERGWTKRVLAIVLGIDETSVSKLVSGKKPVDAEIAIALADVFGVQAEDFMALQRDYDLAKARLVARPDPGRTARRWWGTDYSCLSTPITGTLSIRTRSRSISISTSRTM